MEEVIEEAKRIQPRWWWDIYDDLKVFILDPLGLTKPPKLYIRWRDKYRKLLAYRKKMVETAKQKEVDKARRLKNSQMTHSQIILQFK